MSEIIGKEIQLGVKVEGTRGTAETVASKWVKNVTADIFARVEKVVDDNSQGVLEDSSQTRVIKKWFDGELAGIVHADAIGYFFEQIYGQSTTTTVETGEVYSHAYSVLQNIEHPTLSLFAKDGGVSQEVFNGGVVSTLELTATVDDFLRFSSSLMAKDATANSDTPAYATDYDFIGKDIIIKIASTEAGLSSATALKAKELGITWDTGATADYCFGAYSPSDVYNQKMMIEGTITKNYIDDTFKDLLTSDTAVYMEIAIVGETVLEGSNSPEIKILLNKVQVQDWDRSGANDDIVTEEITFKALYNNADSQQSELTLQNTTASY